MKNLDKEYDEYKEIPKDNEGRLDYLLNKFNLSKSKDIVYKEIERISNIKWKKLSYTIYLVPHATPRPRFGKNGIWYVSGSKNNKSIMEKFIKEMNDIILITTPIKFKCRSYFPIPKSMNILEKFLSEMGFIRPISKPDWDNVAKTYCDMINDLLIYDDSLIIEGVSEKFYSIKPRIEITLEYMENHDSLYNERKMSKKGN